VTSRPEFTPVAHLGAAETTDATALYARHREAVRGFLQVRCRDAELADELTQETFARIVLASRQVDPARNVAGYLVTVARNVWRDWLRRELVRRRAEALLTRAGASAPHAPPADSELLARELQQALATAIARLPREQRDVVRLRHRDQLTFQQIADRLQRPLGTVLTQMRAALRRMQDTMEAYR